MTCRDQVSNQVDGSGGGLWPQVQRQVGRLVVRSSALWDRHLRTHAVSGYDRLCTSYALIRRRTDRGFKNL